MPILQESKKLTELRETLKRYKSVPAWLTHQIALEERLDAERKAALAQLYWAFINEAGHLREFTMWSLRRDNTPDDIMKIVEASFAASDSSSTTTKEG